MISTTDIFGESDKPSAVDVVAGIAYMAKELANVLLDTATENGYVICPWDPSKSKGLAAVAVGVHIVSGARLIIVQRRGEKLPPELTAFAWKVFEQEQLAGPDEPARCAMHEATELWKMEKKRDEPT